MGIQLTALVLIPCAVAVLAWLLRRSEGALFRLSLIPGLVRGELTKWISDLGVPTRSGRILLRAGLMTGYLTANIEEAIENVRLVGSRMRDARGPARREAHVQAFHLVARMWARSAGIVVIASASAATDLIAGIVMVSAKRGLEAVGHLTTPLVMGAVIWAYSEMVDHVRTSSNAPKLGPVVLARWALAVGSGVALVGGQAWAGGSWAAELLGRIAMCTAVVAGFLPLRRWVEGDYLGWRRWSVVASTPLSGSIAFVATVVELSTSRGSLDPWTVAGDLLGATALLLASFTLALIALDPPPPGRSLSPVATGPGSSSASGNGE